MRASWRREEASLEWTFGRRIMLDGGEPEILAFGGNEMSKDTKVSLGNGEKSSVTHRRGLLK